MRERIKHVKVIFENGTERKINAGTPPHGFILNTKLTEQGKVLIYNLFGYRNEVDNMFIAEEEIKKANENWRLFNFVKRLHKRYFIK